MSGLNIIDGSMENGNVRKSAMVGFASVGVQLLLVGVSPRAPLQTYVVGFGYMYMTLIDDDCIHTMCSQYRIRVWD